MMGGGRTVVGHNLYHTEEGRNVVFYNVVADLFEFS